MHWHDQTRAQGLVRQTNGASSILLDGVNYLSSAYPVLGVRHPDFQAQGGRDVVQIALSDPAHALRTAFEARPPQGLRLELGLLITDGSERLHLPYYRKGRCAAAECGLDEAQGQYCSLTFTGQLDKLDADSAMMLTKDNQKQRDATDTIFDSLELTAEWKWVDDN